MQSKLFAKSTSVFVAVIVAGCGGTTPSATAPSPSASASGETIKVATDAKLGQILVDEEGKTLYLFVADKGTASTCYTSCATIWPPVLTTGAPQAGTGADASMPGRRRARTARSR